MSEATTAGRRFEIRRNFEPGTPGARAFDWLRRNLVTLVVISLINFYSLTVFNACRGLMPRKPLPGGIGPPHGFPPRSSWEKV